MPSEEQILVQELQAQVQDLEGQKLALAMMLVKAAGGEILVPRQMLESLRLKNTTWLHREVDPATGDILFRTSETTPTEH